MAATEVINSDYLVGLDDRLHESDTSLPAVGVNLQTVSPDTDIPLVTIDYGFTETGKGLETVDLRRFESIVGWALPVADWPRGQAKFFPIEYDEKGVGHASQTSGIWRQRQSAGWLITHRPDEEPAVKETRLTDFSNRPFASWEIPVVPAHPYIIDDPEAAAEEAARAMRVVRKKPGIWQDMYEEDGRLRQHFVAIGGDAVRASLDAIQDPANGASELPEPLINMIEMIRSELKIALPVDATL